LAVQPIRRWHLERGCQPPGGGAACGGRGRRPRPTCSTAGRRSSGLAR